MEIKSLIEEKMPEIIAFRRKMHEYPSLSGYEQPACAEISAMLNKYGIKHELLLDGTAICASIGSGKVPCTALRADIDALLVTEESGLSFASKNAGIMHACGHDIHCSVALGAAIILKQIEAEIPGTVKIFFQPAEETTGGAERMIKAGVLEKPKVSHVIGLHVSTLFNAGEIGFRYGKMYAASDVYEIKVQGVSSHGAEPQNGVDAIRIACEIVSAMQKITDSNSDPYGKGIISVGKISGGTACNIISAEAKIEGIMRSLSEQDRQNLREGLAAAAKETAEKFGGRAELIIKPSYTALINDDRLVQKVRETAENLIGAEKVRTEDFPQMGAEDFAYFAQAVPSCFYHLGSAFEGRENAPLHNSKFNADENCMPLGIEMQVKAVLDILNELKSARKK